MRDHRVRVLLDANIYLSFLISQKDKSGSIESLIESVLEKRFTLLLPVDLIDEITRSLGTKPYFQARVDQSTAIRVLDEFKRLAEHVTTPYGPLMSITRDPKDDYLIACALSSGAHYLVSGDKDLLVLGDLIVPLKMRTPSAFLAELD